MKLIEEIMGKYFYYTMAIAIVICFVVTYLLT
jgi:hypothetical protein